MPGTEHWFSFNTEQVLAQMQRTRPKMEQRRTPEQAELAESKNE